MLRLRSRLVGGLLIAALSLSTAAQAQKGRRTGSEDITVFGQRKSPDSYFLGWQEYRSKHFVVDTNLWKPIVGDLIEKLEKLRAMGLASVPTAEPAVLPGRIRVIAAGASGRFVDLARDEYQVGSGPHCTTAAQNCNDVPFRQAAINCGRYAAGYFISRLREPTIVLPVSGLRANAEVVAHELAHHLASTLFVNPPTWFLEGFASFVQTIGGFPLENTPRTGSHIQRGERVIRASVGLAAPGFIAAACGDWVPAKDVLGWTGQESPARPGRFHTQSWLLYHWLWNERSKQLAKFQALLASAIDAATAWREVFPEFKPDDDARLRALDDLLDKHRWKLDETYYRREADADDAYTVEPLAPADAHMLWLDGRYSAQSGPKDNHSWLRPELHDLLLEEPLHPVGLAWSAELDQTPALDLLREATEKWPSDWRAWLFRGDAANVPEERGMAYKTAVELNPDSALAQEKMALFLASNGSPLEALSFSKQAVSLAPWNASAAATLAVVDAALGQCPQAREMDARARRLSGLAELPKQLAEVERRCSAPY